MHPFSYVGFNNPFYSCNPGDAALDKLREDKETAENQVRLSVLGRPSRGLVSFILLKSLLNRFLAPTQSGSPPKELTLVQPQENEISVTSDVAE